MWLRGLRNLAILLTASIAVPLIQLFFTRDRLAEDVLDSAVSAVVAIVLFVYIQKGNELARWILSAFVRYKCYTR